MFQIFHITLIYYHIQQIYQIIQVINIILLLLIMVFYVCILNHGEMEDYLVI
nr:MAG TPA: hypothetical protein [Bacteriophage sp.]